jgi:exopolysaccharide biosynthesis polyprenyl glycosylphosphotransferase
MKSRQIKRLTTLLLAGSDVALSFVAFALAHVLRLRIAFPREAVGVAPFHTYLPMILCQMMFVVMIFFLYRLYHQPRRIFFFDELFSVFGAVSVSFMISLSATLFTLKNSSLQLNFSRAMLIYAWTLSIMLIMASRTLIHDLFRRARSEGFGLDRAIIVGTGKIGCTVARMIGSSSTRDYDIIGMVAGSAPPSAGMPGVPFLGKVEELPELIAQNDVDEIIITLPEISKEEMLDIINRCDRSTLKIRIFSNDFSFLAGRLSIDNSGGIPLLALQDIALRGWQLAVKRMVDIVIAIGGLIVLSPLMAVVALIIKLESRGPVFYVQERMGLDAVPFRMLKFRSMRHDAEASGPSWTTKGDPRRTRIGAFLRRYNIDELPQLFNVIFGQMSLVGPRAERPYFVEAFRKSIPGYMNRHREKAGMTGWAQINGLRGDTSIEERTRFDLWYIENWSPLLDFKIIFRQILQTFSSKNAY